MPYSAPTRLLDVIEPAEAEIAPAADNRTPNRSNTLQNKLGADDRSVHDWYRFVLSFPPHVVQEYLADFGAEPGNRVLDPFCGTGTTLVECKKNGIESVGFESSPAARFATAVKVDWAPQPDAIARLAHAVKLCAEAEFATHDPTVMPPEMLRGLPADAARLLLTDSVSPVPLHRLLVLRDCIERHTDPATTGHAMLAFVKTAVATASNLKFGPEVGVSGRKTDALVLHAWLDNMRVIARDLASHAGGSGVQSQVLDVDARTCANALPAASIDAVFTSPPYPNEKDYTRTTRLEAVLLGFLHDRTDLRAVKRALLRSNTRGVYKGDDDDRWIANFPQITEIAETIERRRIELNKTSGFERLYGRVTKLYFGGMARHFAELRHLLRPGARLGYMVGDQASYLRIPIATGELLGQIAQTLGYELVRIDLFRTRLSTATKLQMREEVLVLRWPGWRDGSEDAGVFAPCNGLPRRTLAGGGPKRNLNSYPCAPIRSKRIAAL